MPLVVRVVRSAMPCGGGVVKGCGVFVCVKLV